MNKETLKEYCTGCGLCKSFCNVGFINDSKGYNVPLLENDEQIDFCKRVCPAAGRPSRKMKAEQIWGRSESVCLGWSNNPKIRKKASSGGILTSLCCYLLDEKIVDGIIQTSFDCVVPYRTKTVVSYSSEDVLKCMGSRYSISSPLIDIKNLIQKSKIYAFIGKPCDVAALKMLLLDNKKLSDCIKFLFSFFCAGEPSEISQQRLLLQLGCKTEKDCLSLQYRGNGWPGYTIVEKIDGTQKNMTYAESWGKILGRDVRKCCRICVDGIGEFADVSCGDAWYLTNEGKPDFSENEGRNVVFARTPLGVDLLNQACDKGYIVLSPYVDYHESLKIIQKYQYERRTTMGAMLFAMRLCGKKVPDYDKKVLITFGKGASLQKKVERMLGTFKRIKQGKL